MPVGRRVDTPAFILLSGFVLACLLLLSCGIGLWTLHRSELREAQRNLTRLARVLSEQTALAFHEIDTVIKEARLVRQRTPDVPEQVRHEQLHRIFQGFLQGQALLLFGPDGQMLAHSREFPTPDVNVADRAYFQAHRDDARDVPYISKPLQNRVNGHWMISLSRRLSAPDGGFGGVIMEETGFATAVADKLAIIRHGYTTYRVTLHCFLLSLPELDRAAPPPDPVLTAAQESLWVPRSDLTRFAFPAGHRKLIDSLARDLRLS